MKMLLLIEIWELSDPPIDRNTTVMFPGPET